MNQVQTIHLYRTNSGYALYRNRTFINRFFDKGYALRVTKQVFDATKKLATGPVFFNDFTSFKSEV